MGDQYLSGKMKAERSAIQMLEKTLEYSRKQDYKGYDKHDGMSSKILQKIPVDNKWINLIFQEGVKRAPINLRPVFLVEQRRNPKGIALFVLSNINLYELTGKEKYLTEAKKLAEWLIDNQIDGYSGFSVGHSHEVQGLNKKYTTDIPWVVQTSYAVKALLRLNEHEKDDKIAKIAHSSSKLIFNELGYTEFDEKAQIKYHPNDSEDSHNLNANALGARLLIDLYYEFNENKLLDASTKILNYVVSQQREQGGWMYTDPPSASHLSMDNYHNGFIIESLLRYQEVTDSNRYEESIEKALKFYRGVLYNKHGSPNWDENSEYPKDTHAVAQGIIVFNMDEDMGFSKKILDWTLDNLYAGDGRFYYQKKRFYTKKFTLMRWCQAWMAYAISEYLIGKNH